MARNGPRDRTTPAGIRARARLPLRLEHRLEKRITLPPRLQSSPERQIAPHVNCINRPTRTSKQPALPAYAVIARNSVSLHFPGQAVETHSTLSHRHRPDHRPFEAPPHPAELRQNCTVPRATRASSRDARPCKMNSTGLSYT